MSACFCIGPQPGQTKCPCQIRAEIREDIAGYYDNIQDRSKKYYDDWRADAIRSKLPPITEVKVARIYDRIHREGNDMGVELIDIDVLRTILKEELEQHE